MRISDLQVLKWFAFIFSYFLIYCLSWTIISPPYITEKKTTESVRYEFCTNKNSTFTSIDDVSRIVLFIYGIFLCYRIQGIKGEWAMFNESKQIGISIYIGAFILCIDIAAKSVLDYAYQYEIANSILNAFCAMIFLAIMIFPSLVHAYNRTTKEEFVASAKTRSSLNKLDKKYSTIPTVRTATGTSSNVHGSRSSMRYSSTGRVQPPSRVTPSIQPIPEK